jgi:SAM-dependent methyltransferase
MGLGITILTLLDRMCHDGTLPRTGSVVEIGSQDLYLKGYAQALETFGAPFGVSLAALADPARSRAGAKALFEGIGWTYASLDLDDGQGATPIDLNYDPAPQGATYDLVTNLGTTEHILNQVNCFRVIHDLVRVGGVMLHLVPFLGYVDHGFFSYHPNLFRALAAGNGYDVLGVYYNPARSSPVLIPWADDLLSFVALTGESEGAIIVAMRKTGDAPFVIPQQGRYGNLRLDVPLDGRSLNGGMSAREIELAEGKAARKAERRAARNRERDQATTPRTGEEA